MVKNKAKKTQYNPWIDNLTRWNKRFQSADILNGMAEISPEQRTPRTEADNALNWVATINNCTGADKSGQSFLLMMAVIAHDGVTGKGCLNLVKAAELSVNFQGKPAGDGLRLGSLVTSLMYVVCAYAKQAINEQSNLNLAWSYANEANRWLGVLQGLTSGSVLGKSLGAKRKAKAGGDVKNLENRQMKAEVFAWCDAHMRDDKSMKSIAAEISERLVPVKPDTVYSWVREWKKVRSAGTP